MSLFKPRYPYFFAANLIILAELLSFAAYFFPWLQPYLLAASFLAVFLLSLFNLELGLLTAVVELVIGSKGHLFSADIFGFPASLRLAIWSALMLASLIFIIRKGGRACWREHGQSYHFWKPLLILSAFIALAFGQGLINRHAPADILADGNAWLYLTLILPILLVYQPAAAEKQKRLLSVFFLAVGWLSFKTLALLFIFSHNLAIVPDIYLWVRRSGIGEITAMGGGWYRVFIQSQVYAPIAFFLILWPLMKAKDWSRGKKRLMVAALAILLAVIIISMSRSFWLAFIVAGAIAIIAGWGRAWRSYLRAGGYIAAALLAATFLIFIVVKFPYPNQQAGLSAEALTERLNMDKDEAAVASRWALLPNLWQEIKKAPFFGQGFGTTVSYYSRDPRVLINNPDGWYTTYAFEWAYLDTWLKIGLFGLLPYLVWLVYLISGLCQQERRRGTGLYLALASSLFFLMIVNVFTPYLNHPLGLSFLLFSSCFFQKKSI